MDRVRIGIVGIGDISGIYLENLTQLFREIEIVGICDLVRAKAERASEKYGLTIYETMYDLFADARVEIILNLTRPNEHHGVSKAALEAGKHVYSEKPLAATLEQGRELFALAQSKGLMLGGAPDTFLGAGIQTCRKLIEDGYIGTPVGARAAMICHGHESWHPDPAFYYQAPGGGPMLDMGPYYVTALVNLLGSVQSVTGLCKTTFPQRLITSERLRGTVIDAEVPTYITGLLEFESGAIGSLFTTFDAHYNRQADFEIYGTEGTLIVPDPNTFEGPVKLLRPGNDGFMDMPLLFDYAQNSRGLGLADMAKALRTGRRFRADVEQTLHVLEVMTAFTRSSDAGKKEAIQTRMQPRELMQRNPMRGIIR